ncbi:ATP-binding protein [Microbacterium paludicola]|uniref:ATP-binding protein n=1 Tax=Microbacterium paludicola TaxID=300019 RepID=UPI003879F1F8
MSSEAELTQSDTGVAPTSLEIRFHGRVIEHLGIDMYQSPVAAIAELISNAWDADAELVEVSLPENVGEGSFISINDNGSGMTLAECQERFLRVGYNRRGKNARATTPNGRPTMGRKGIGKFAGFGIAKVLRVETTSQTTGESTVFALDVSRLLGSPAEEDSPDDEARPYVDSTPLAVDVLSYSPPDAARIESHGTRITLQGLTLSRTPNVDQFRKSMARRFRLMQRADTFTVLVNNERLPESEELGKVEFDFPTDYADDERPTGVTIADGWGAESVDGNEIRWRFQFQSDPIDDDELAGVSVFSHGKLAQRPFLFNLAGGFGGQYGVPYLTGSVVADFIDEQNADLISTERQRVNWEDPRARALLQWGQARVQELLRLWQKRRADEKVRAMESRLSTFSQRLERLERHEKRVVERALKAIARISVLSDNQFDELASAILTAWEGGRLRDLISELADADDMDAEALVALLAESNVMTALHAAERVKAQLNLISGLRERINKRELENAIRDYISENPWLVSPKWETFRTERAVRHLLDEASAGAKLNGEDWNGRVDLALSSGEHLLVMEFMRPGLRADWDHVSRFERYVLILREKVPANTRFKHVSGLLVADRLADPEGIAEKLRQLRASDMDARDWESLLVEAEAQWSDYFRILYDRAPEDERMRTLAAETRQVDVSSIETDKNELPGAIEGNLTLDMAAPSDDGGGDSAH